MKINYKLDLRVVLVALTVTTLAMSAWVLYLQHHTNQRKQHEAMAYALQQEQQPEPTEPTPVEAPEPPKETEVVKETAPVPEPAPSEPVEPTPAPEPEPAPVSTDRQALMSAAGIPIEDQSYAESIMNKESTWCYKRMNGDHRPCESIPQPSVKQIGDRAYGLCQSLPATKMATAGADWLTNPVTQLKWCNSYAAKYGGWAESHQFWLKNKWW